MQMMEVFFVSCEQKTHFNFGINRLLKNCIFFLKISWTVYFKNIIWCRVKAEGIPVEKVQSEFKCLDANTTEPTKVRNMQPYLGRLIFKTSMVDPDRSRPCQSGSGFGSASISTKILAKLYFFWNI